MDDNPAPELAIATRALTRVFTRMSVRPWSERLTRRARREAARPGGSEGPAALQRIVALDGVNLEVRRGEIFGLLGPNGAGKTTLIKILSTLLLPTSGRAWVEGLDVVRQAAAVRRRMAMVSGGEVSGYGILTVRENLWLFSQLHGVPAPEARRRIDALLAELGLQAYRHTKMNRLSTGFRQRLNVARGFVSDPDVLFLDEPTLGLDVESARTVRAFVRRWVKGRPGRTVLLTTHYMLEADELCDRVAIIDRGRVAACDTPANLKRLLASDVVLRVRVAAGDGAAGRLVDQLAAVEGVRRAAGRVVPGDGTVDLTLVLAHDGGVPGVLQALERFGGRLLELHKPEPTLEEVFLKVVGRRLDDEGTAGP